jgi:hypothetical protein
MCGEAFGAKKGKAPSIMPRGLSLWGCVWVETVVVKVVKVLGPDTEGNVILTKHRNDA